MLVQNLLVCHWVNRMREGKGRTGENEERPNWIDVAFNNYNILLTFAKGSCCVKVSLSALLLPPLGSRLSHACLSFES